MRKRRPGWWVLALVGVVVATPLPASLEDATLREETRRLVVTGGTITLHDDGGAHSIEVADIASVSVRTNDRGPLEDDMFWVFTTAAGETLEAPSDLPGEKDLWTLFKSLHGFDYRMVIYAAGSSKNETRLCWRRVEPKAEVARKAP